MMRISRTSRVAAALATTAVLTDGTVPLTVVAPDDRAVALLLADLTAQHPRSDEAVFNALVAAAGVDTIEQVLLHHVHSRRHDR